MKPIIKEGESPAGLAPDALTETFNITDVQPNRLYDATVRDYGFLDSQAHDEGYVDEDQFGALMTVLDLMFPYKYHAITVDVGGNSFQQIKTAVQEVLRAPAEYMLGLAPFRPNDAQIARVYQHFAHVREETKQPLLMNLRIEPSHKERYFLQTYQKQPTRSNPQKIRPVLNVALVDAMLGEYVVARELLNCYHLGLKYYDALAALDEPPGPDFDDFDPQNVSFRDTVRRFVSERRPTAQAPAINPVYPVQIPYKPYLSSEQLRQQLQRTEDKYKDLYQPIENTRGTVDKVKRETNEFLDFYNEVMDGVDD